MTNNINVPIWEKITLTIEEASALSGIGICRIRDMLKMPGCNFVLYNGKKQLIKRKPFENYLENALEICA